MYTPTERKLEDICPNVSVILPIRNESEFIERNLDSILNQDYPIQNLEVLIADGMSTDNTREIITNIINKNPHVSITLLDNPNKIVSTGLNNSLRQAKGQIIIRIDGHTIVAPTYVQQCVDALQHSRAENVGGRMNSVGYGFFGAAVSIATSSPFGIGGARFHYSEKEEWVDTVYMGAWPRKVFEEIGIFDEELVRDQDDEFNYRLREYGGKILLSPKIKSIYNVRSSPEALWKQYFQYGYWKVRVMQKHPRQMRPRQFVPPTFIVSIVFAVIFSLINPIGLWILYGIVGSYLFVNLIASIITAAKKGWKHLPLLPIVFSLLHISYGVGFLAGLVKFANRWGDKTGKTPKY